MAKRKLGLVVKRWEQGEWILSIPYLYDVWVGVSTGGLSVILTPAIGMCAVLVISDVAWFVYSRYGLPSDLRVARKWRGTA